MIIIPEDIRKMKPMKMKPYAQAVFEIMKKEKKLSRRELVDMVAERLGIHPDDRRYTLNRRLYDVLAVARVVNILSSTKGESGEVVVSWIEEQNHTEKVPIDNNTVIKGRKLTLKVDVPIEKVAYREQEIYIDLESKSSVFVQLDN
jgi:hypothetical protein